VLAYEASGSNQGNVFDEGATGSLSGFNLAANTLTVDTAATSAFSLLSGLKNALGSNTGSDFLYDAVGGFTAGVDLDLNLSASSFNFNRDINIGTGTLTLDAAGKVSQTSSGDIEANILTGSSAGTLKLTGMDNGIADLGAFSTGGHLFDLTNAAVLTTTGLINTGAGEIKLTTTGTGHGIAVDSELEGGIVDLISAATIAESSTADIDATTLTGKSDGTAKLTSSKNTVTDLGIFSTGGSLFELTDAAALTTTGTVNTGTAEIKLTTTGTGHGIAVDSKLEGGIVDLISAATIAESSMGDLDATTLTGKSDGTAKLTSSKNTVTDLGAFSTGGNHAFEFKDNSALTVDGAVNAGTGILDLTTLGSGNNLAIDSTITGSTINLVTAGEAKESSAGAIVASTILNVTASTGIDLNSSKNKIKKVGTDHTGSGPNKIKL
jgi:hypothetical protein